MKAKFVKEKALSFLLAFPAVILLLAFLSIILFIGIKGLPAVNWKMLTTSVQKGGIFESVVGTLYLLAGTLLIATPLGVATAVYLVEYAPKGRVNRIITQALNNLAGVPSIVFGLFGYVFFCRFLGLGISLLSGWLTLTCMVLPIIVRGSQEALRMVPKSFREAAEALGAPKWRVIKDVVLPTATPGLATSTILGVSRVAGETAAILFTCSVFLMKGLPSTPFQPVMVLTYQLYTLLVASPSVSFDRAFAMALVLLGVVVILNIFAYLMRVHYRKKWKW